MPKEINPWAMYPRKTSTASLPEVLKHAKPMKENVEKYICDKSEHMIYNETVQTHRHIEIFAKGETSGSLPAPLTVRESFQGVLEDKGVIL